MRETVPVEAGPSATDLNPQHHLEADQVSLGESTVFSIANGAPTVTLSLTMAALVLASARGGAAALLITTLPMLAIAWSFARLNRWDPDCGASYVWIARIFGPVVGFAIGWVVLTCNVIGTTATVLPVGPSFLSVLGLDPNAQLGAVLSGGFLTVLVMGIAIIGINLTARTQLVLAGVEFGIVLIFGAIGIWKTFIHHAAGFAEPSWSWLNPTGIGSHGALGTTLLLSVFFLAGWDASFYVSEETRDPHRTPGRAVIGSIAFMAVFFAFCTLAFQGVASLHQLDEHQAAGLSYVGSRLAGGTGDRLLSIAVLLSAIATTQTSLVLLSRLTYAMGNHRLLPGGFAKVNERFRTPVFGTVVAAICVIAIMVGAIYIGSVASAFETTVAATGVLFAIYYSATALAASWHYRFNWAAGGRERLALVLPVLAAGFLIWVGVKSIVGFTPGTRWVLVGIAVMGVIAMAVAKWVHRSPFFSLRREPGLLLAREAEVAPAEA
ncbi:MAG: APC family permease [Actinobacteria bacterium]|nr:APC family permease [Actinomycetota bacterium]